MLEYTNNDTAKLLVIDDDAGLLYAVRKSLESQSLQVHLANSGSEGLRSFTESTPDVVLLDLRLNDASGLEVLQEIRKLDRTVPVIVFTAYSTPEATIEATQTGAFEYLLKPVDLVKLKRTIDRAVGEKKLSDKTSSEFLSNRLIEPNEVTIIGSSPAMQDVYKKIGRFSGSTSNVLILGESGTGKDLAAKAIHQHSKRRKAPFLAINCAALSETLLESELFGHERGAFTGAEKRRVGKFEYAHGGTIFLDEIGDMSASTQAKVLRLLQEQQFERLGGNETIKTDVRIIAATNKDLIQLMQEGKFRDDLFYRLNVFTIEMPPLRARISDLKDLFRYFISLYKKDFDRELVHISQEVDELMATYDWPGNMRELQSATRHALAHMTAGHISVDQLPVSIQNASKQRIAVGADVKHWQKFTEGLIAEGAGQLYERCVAVLDKTVIPIVLTSTGGNLQHACDILGISRNTLKSKLREHAPEFLTRTVKD